MKKLISLLLALAMILMVGAAFATTTPTGSITVEKNFKDQVYELYKLFDAVADPDREGETGISYQLMSGKNGFKATVNGSEVDGSQWFKVDTAGNVSLADGVSSIAFDSDPFKGWAKAYGTKVGDTLTATADNDANIKWESLADGYYFITTTTGSLVTVDSIRPNVKVNDKNEVPTLDKKITGASSIDADGKKAIAQVGTSVEYTLTVTKKAGAENYVVHDTMGTGLKYNKDVKVYTGTGDNKTEVDAANYAKTETDTTLQIAFVNTWIAGLTDNTEISVVYTALITEDALHTDAAKNTAYLEYGHNPGENKTPTKTTETYNATLEVEKQDGQKKALAGAGFVLMNANNKYYKYTAATDTAPEKVEWVDSADNATQYTSGEDGKLDGKFSGLADGTYTLVEKTVPTGYNKAADYTFTIAEADFTDTNLLKSTTVVNNQGTELPSTGGIGTTIFYVVGGLLLVGAAIVLVARRKANN